MVHDIHHPEVDAPTRVKQWFLRYGEETIV
jgi:hypothetical protein